MRRVPRERVKVPRPLVPSLSLWLPQDWRSKSIGGFRTRFLKIKIYTSLFSESFRCEAAPQLITLWEVSHVKLRAAWSPRFLELQFPNTISEISASSEFSGGLALLLRSSAHHKLESGGGSFSLKITSLLGTARVHAPLAIIIADLACCCQEKETLVRPKLCRFSWKASVLEFSLLANPSARPLSRFSHCCC